MKHRLLGKTQDELKEIALAAGLPAFAGKQMAQWLYSKRVRSVEEMTNLSKAGREALSRDWEVGYAAPVDVQTSADGTRKYLFAVNCPVGTGEEESFIEAVMIPDEERKTLCVSSQAGCKMNCKFCMTGRQGFHGNLATADILNQFFAIEEAGELTNAVFMGMGEPLDNWEAVKRAIEVLTSPWGLAWSPKRITLSTIGVLPNLKKYLDESRCHLAVSLHNPFGEERLQLMPVQKAWPLEEVIGLIRQYDFTGQRRVSFEYTVFAGWNDTKRHADALLRLLQGLECRVNLIRFHRIPDFPYGPAPMPRMEEFRDRLSRGGITATIRASRGEDIFAACGLLAGKHKEP
jgi:23S rRNA (adenine2503-C2)-methyltransferase